MPNAIIDTNVLMNEADLSQFNKIYAPITILEELDNHKNSTNQEKAYKARQGLRLLRSLNNVEYKFSFSCGTDFWLDIKVPDNRILAFAKEIYCLDKDAVLYTMDLNMVEKAKAMGVPVVEVEDDCNVDSEYKGYKEIVLDDLNIAKYFELQGISKKDSLNFLEEILNDKINNSQLSLLINEYIIIKDNNDVVVEKLKNVSHGFKIVSSKTIDSRYVGKVKPRNLQQELYMDLLQDKETKVKVVQGNFGTGKDYLALANFLQMIDNGTYKKIIWLRNNIEAADTKPIGYLKGSLTEKLSVFADIVGDFVGDNVGFETLLSSGKLELVHTGFIRGRDLRNSIIYCTEAQNMSESLVKLILSRVSEGSIAFFNGDIKQIDDKHFKNNNGLSLLINKLKGNSLFGYVYLDKCERSEVARLVALLD